MPSSQPNPSASAHPGTFRAWLSASRPATLTAAFAPVLVGVAAAHHLGAVRWPAALVALLGAVFIQIGTNFANDVFDFEKGADNADRVGPPRAAAQGWLTPSALKRAMVITFGLATLCGVYLTSVAGYPIVVIGVLSILSGIAYTGGPYPLGYNGLGDIFVFVFFGFVAVVGTTYVSSGEVSWLACLAAVHVGAIATAVLVVNNARDYATDARVGKRTLVVRFGRWFGTVEYWALMVVALGAVIAVAVLTGRWSAALPLVLLPWTISLCRRLSAGQGAALNPLLASTAKYLFISSAVFAAGLW